MAARLSGSGRSVRPPRPPALGLGELRRRARRLHAGRPIVAYQEKHHRGQRRGQPRRPFGQPFPQLGRGKGRARTPRSGRCARGVMRSMLATVFSALGTPIDPRRRRVRPARSGRQQPNAYVAGQRDLLVSTWGGGALARGRGAHELHRGASPPSGATMRSCGGKRFLYGQEIGRGIRDVDWFDENGATALAGGLERAREARAGHAPGRDGARTARSRSWRCCSTARTRPSASRCPRTRDRLAAPRRHRRAGPPGGIARRSRLRGARPAPASSSPP